jgi:hypothetical protein
MQMKAEINHISPYIHAIASILLFLLWSTATADMNGIYLIFTGSFAEGTPNAPFVTVIYRLDEQGNRLDSIWSSGTGPSPGKVAVYSNNGPVIISESEYHSYKRLHIFSPVDMPREGILDLTVLGKAYDYTFLQDQHGADRVNIKYADIAEKNAGPKNKSQLYSLNGEPIPETAPTGGSLLEQRLTGVSTYPPDEDVIRVKFSPDGKLRATDSLEFNGAPLADSMVHMKHSFGWTMIANEPMFRAIEPIPDGNSRTEREILVYNRLTQNWHSYVVGGAATWLRLTNGWLTGVVADPDPETDYATRKGFPPILREDVVLVNPMEGHVFTVHLGKGCEVLWIEGSDVYYRVGTDLYKAKIQNDDFVDRTLLLSDPRMRSIHWAFRGSEGK